MLLVWRRELETYSDDVNLEPDQISREFSESIGIPDPVPTLDGYVQPLGVTELPQPGVESNDRRGIARARIQYADKGELSF